APRPQAAAEGAGQAPQQAQAPAKTLQVAPMRRDEPAAQPVARARAGRESETAKMEPPQVPSRQAFGVVQTESTIKAQPVMVVSVKGKTMWRIGVGGEVDASSDSGRTWKRQSLPDGTFIYAASAPEENVCWLAGRSGALFRTTDGERWQKLPPPVHEDLVSVRATSAHAAEVRAASGRTFVTRDAGRTWSPKE
ncbi:MAG TPA: YCF48-related protein, partial [Candidatus Nitrosotenuis sp.]|nr:YCF48-related protein [Candidatus Nitrosotenuis sp.]